MKVTSGSIFGPISVMAELEYLFVGKGFQSWK